MKPLALICCHGLALATATAADDAEASVRFSNNDRLGGTVDSLTPDMLVWKSPALAAPSAFFIRNVMDLLLPAVPPENAAEHEATLKLTNGDSICGQLAAVTDETVTLDTWFAGRMQVNRLMVSEVKIAGKSTFVYRGPSGLDGWQQAGDKGAWSYSRSAFLSNGVGSIARDELLTDECTITFDLAWKGDALGFKVNAFSDNPATDGSLSGYEISFQRGSVFLRNSKTQGFLGSASAQALMEDNHAHIEIRASLKSGKVCLFINERIIEVWADPDVAKGKFGRCLHFISTSPSPLRVAGIGIAPWDGVIDRLPEARVGIMRQFNLQGLDEEAKPAPPQKPQEGRMELANGDNIEGEVVSISKGMIAVKTPLGDVQMPVERLRTVALKKADLERCKRHNGDIRAWFGDGSSLVFRLEGVSDGTLTGFSQNFGTATFKTAAFNRLEFNIHDPALEDKRLVDKRQPGDW